MVAHRGAVDRRSSSTEPSSRPAFDHDRQAVLALVQRGEVGRQPLREHGEDPGRGVDRVVLWPAWRSMADPAATSASTSAMATQHADVRRADGFGDRELVEVAGVVVVDREPGELAQVADRRVLPALADAPAAPRSPPAPPAGSRARGRARSWRGGRSPPGRASAAGRFTRQATGSTPYTSRTTCTGTAVVLATPSAPAAGGGQHDIALLARVLPAVKLMAVAVVGPRVAGEEAGGARCRPG